MGGITTVVGTEAEFCYTTYNSGFECSLRTGGPLGSNLGLGPFGVEDVEESGASGYPFTVYGELSFSLSGTVEGQPAMLGLVIYDDPFSSNGALIALPEPSTYTTLGVGVLAIVVFRRKIGRAVLY